MKVIGLYYLIEVYKVNGLGESLLLEYQGILICKRVRGRGGKKQLEKEIEQEGIKEEN